MKPKGWKNDPQWRMYEENRRAIKQMRIYHLGLAAAVSAESAIEEASEAFDKEAARVSTHH